MKLFEKKYILSKDVSDFGAFEPEIVSFELQIPRQKGCIKAYMHLFGDGIAKDFYLKKELLWTDLNGIYDIYRVDMDMSEIGIGLYYYKYEIVCDEGSKFYAERQDDFSLLKMENENDGLIQLLIYNNREQKPDFMYGGIMYHIFVDRFRKSGKTNPKKYAIMNDDWYNGIPQFADYPGGFVANNMFFGGDLYGIVEKLDYIKSLGVNCIYLSPVFEAYSNHKYDTGDYMTIDSMFGGEEAFDLFLQECKEREIHVILDGVFNHTGADSIYFNKFGNYNSVGAYQSKNSKYFEWFNFKNYPDKYECWWDVTILPRVKSDLRSYRDYILGNGGVVEKWAKKGIDGFRLDVADELSDDFLTELSTKLQSINPNGIVYGEVWEDASNKIAYDKRKSYFLGNELDSVMNYPVREAIINYIKFGEAEKFKNICQTLYLHYPKGTSDLLMNLLGTHDTERILTVLGTNDLKEYTNKELSVKKLTVQERKKAIKLLKMAYTINATLPGIPCIYYGDEAGMEGYRDPFNRMPYPWGKENKELIEFYKAVGKIRTSEKVYKEGFFKITWCDSDILSFSRYEKNINIITVMNRSENKYKISSNSTLEDLKNGEKVSFLPPLSSFILKSSKSFEKTKIEFHI